MENTTSPAARAAAVGFLLTAAGAVGDMWVQNDRCARIKGAHDDAPVIDKDEDTGAVIATHKAHEGRLACVEHVATYTATQAAALVAGNRALGLGIRPSRMVAALAVSAVTHYVADRRRPLQRLADATGKHKFYRVNAGGMNGAFHLDQAWHRGWEAVAAVIAGR